MIDALRVKAESDRHPAADVHPVMKLNAVRDFQTGIYDYNVMTSAFARVAPGWSVAKVSFTGQEWCGHVFHQILPRGGRVIGTYHSYFEAEADGGDDLPLPEGGVFEDVLPILLRGWIAPYLAPGESRTVPFLPSLLRVRLEHRRLAWGRAVISRSASATALSVPAGRFRVVTWTVAEEGGRTTTYQVESEPPYRIVRWAVDTGEEAVLRGSARLAYWKLNAPGGDAHLEELGLEAPGQRTPRSGR
jgi:hypothetical protein